MIITYERHKLEEMGTTSSMFYEKTKRNKDGCRSAGYDKGSRRMKMRLSWRCGGQPGLHTLFHDFTLL